MPIVSASISLIAVLLCRLYAVGSERWCVGVVGAVVCGYVGVVGSER